jgi:uncharacterized protein (UPF0335 family)
MNRDKLKRIVESIEAAEKAIKTYSDHKREIYATNKDEFEPKVLRKIIARRKMDPDSRTKDDDLLDQYEVALGMVGELAKAAASGEVTYQEAADAAHVSKRTMARHVARAKAVPESTDDGIDPETGEVHGAELQTQSASAEDDGGDRRDHPPVAIAAGRDAPAHTGGEEGSDAGGGAAGECGTGEQAPLTVEMGHPASSTDAPPDDLAFPAHLRRERVSANG